MLFGQHPALDRKRSRIFVALIIGDVLGNDRKGQDAGQARSIAKAFSVRCGVGEETPARHAFGVIAGHAANVGVPFQGREAVLGADEVGLFEGATLDGGGFGECWSC